MQNFRLGVVARARVGAQLIRGGDDRLLLAQGVIHVHQRADVAEDDTLPLELLIIRRLFKLLDDGRGRGEYGRHGDLFKTVALERGIDRLSPVDELSERHVRAAHKAQLRRGVGVFPNDGVARLDALELRVVDDVDLRALGYQAIALLDRFGREIFDVVQSDRAV